ncbi:hypothetical protein [Ruminococcus sp.]|uniref:hypothetical protein n=1 Tax=Ruminococcus sp. TaxID=41978 RepID=UPI0025FA791F|nr:hypothetical protein [Ruminococcus sp.]MBQ8966144.1 hypothetical protein [Ruminococcus sp.]
MSKCIKCGGETAFKTLSPDEGSLLYKYYYDGDVVEHYSRYLLGCEECQACGGRGALYAREVEEGTVAGLLERLEFEEVDIGVCPDCGGRLITDMAGMGATGNLLSRFAKERFTYSFALFDMCADCGKISNIHEKLMGE